MDASQRITDLIVLSQRLVELLSTENRSLRSGRMNEVRAMLDQKDEISRAYESRIKGLAEHADDAAMAAVEPALKEQLRGLGDQVQELSLLNARLLKIAMEVNRRVLNEVVAAVKAGQPGAGIYSRTGTTGKGAYRASPSNIPISLNKSL